MNKETYYGCFRGPGNFWRDRSALQGGLDALSDAYNWNVKALSPSNTLGACGATFPSEQALDPTCLHPVKDATVDALNPIMFQWLTVPGVDSYTVENRAQ